MGGKNTTIATEEPRLGNLRVQTSMYGLVVPMIWGTTRVTGNLLWFGNFQATAVTTTTSQGGGGGKGGSQVEQVDTKYTYKAAAILGLAQGPILGIASAWKGKRRYYGYTVPAASTLRQQTFVIPPGTTDVAVALPGAFGGTQSVSVVAQNAGYDGTYVSSGPG